ncbi:MAG: beta-ketoacyl-[acyl-carrier-protein] synthase family protein, partial [Rhodospirillum sp.]|nr:beta-ketoacyl-[acyl-carrier-protein] synthase family protein [Rhodospirillum sp.]
EIEREGLTITIPAAPIVGYRELDHFTNQQRLMLDRFSQYTILAGQDAVAHAGLADDREGWREAAIILGNGGGGELTREDAGVFLFGRRAGKVHPLTVPRTNHQAAASHLAAAHGITGPAYVISTGCASGSHAIGQAVWMIRHGQVNRVLTGGCEANIIFSVAHAFSAVRTVAKDTCRPFSQGRTGFAFGEGAGVFVLESLDAAQARGAAIYGEILGVGMSIDPTDQVQPSHEGPTVCLERTLRDAGRERADVDYINAHGTGTILNDKIESQVVDRFFGDRKGGCPPMSSSKSQIGHVFGAAGALEALICLKALEHQTMPPTMNWLGRDPDCVDLDVVPNAARAGSLETVLSQSFGFGGVNAALLLSAGV